MKAGIFQDVLGGGRKGRLFLEYVEAAEKSRSHVITEDYSPWEGEGERCS